jgi:diaminopimelate epimerase
MPSIAFSKYHALGNSYIVVPPNAAEASDLTALATRICDFRLGVGSDGLLLGPLGSTIADFRLRILNPDGSEAEKSGNGLRIFCRYLWDEKLVSDALFSIETLGGVVSAEILEEGKQVKVEMGKVRFTSKDIPVVGPPREVLLEDVTLDGQPFKFTAATVGNPHCVVLVDRPTESDARKYGPMLESLPLFPKRANVQFMRVLDRGNIQIEIWERGAGYTHASGSSSCAAAAVAYKLGLCDVEITVHMRGGDMRIRLDPEFNVTMIGPVVHVCHGAIETEALG